MLLHDGRPMLIGSEIPPGELTATTEVYDRATETWSYTGSLSWPQWPGWWQTVILNDGRVLVAGGSDITLMTASSSSELYDPTTGLWTLTGNLNTARRAHPLVLLDNGKVLAPSGAQGGPAPDRFLSSSELYDPATGSWSYTGNINIARNGHTAIMLLDGRVLVIGGEGPWLVVQRRTEIYDPTTETWSLSVRKLPIISS